MINKKGQLETLTKIILIVLIVGIGIFVVLASLDFFIRTDKFDVSNSNNQNILADNSTLTILSPNGEGVDAITTATRHNQSWMEFDGVNDFIEIDEQIINFSSGYSFSSWINSQGSNLSSGDGVYIQFINSSGGARPDYLIGVRDTSGVSQFKIRQLLNSSGCDSQAVSTGFAKDDRKWHNVVGVYNRTHLLLYIDGVLNDTQTISLSCINLLKSFDNQNLNMSIGARVSGSSFVRAGMDEVRAYNRSITQAEVTALHSSGRTANASINNSDLIVWYSFNEGSGTTVFDKSGNGNNGI